MKPLTREWVEKAEGDYATAQRELRARKAPNYDAACFHAQQCVEKYLKACLQEADIPFGKTHDLVALFDSILKKKPSLELLRPYMRSLSVYAVELRYPGESADKDMAREALTMCKEVRSGLRRGLGLRAE
jgi:HEPN domain-containing protein